MNDYGDSGIKKIIHFVYEYVNTDQLSVLNAIGSHTFHRSETVKWTNHLVKSLENLHYEKHNHYNQNFQISTLGLTLILIILYESWDSSEVLVELNDTQWTSAISPILLPGRYTLHSHPGKVVVAYLNTCLKTEKNSNRIGKSLLWRSD